MKRKITGLLLAGAVAVVGVIATPTAAQAIPSGCSVQTNGVYATSYCSSGTGQHRAVAYCAGWNTSNQWVPYTAYGAWVGAGRYSTANCSRWFLFGESARGAWIEYR